MTLPLVFPMVGPTWVRDTFHAARDGGARVHQGIDLPLLARRRSRNGGAPYDPTRPYPVRAPVPGTLIRISREGPIGRPNEGNAAFIRDADGWTHLLAHLEAPIPEDMVGTELRAGDFLGLAGNTGNARTTGPHLHYHIVDNHGRRVNPTQRLAMLHAALEETRTAPIATEQRERYTDAQRDRQRAGRPRLMPRGSVMGDDAQETDLAYRRRGAMPRADVTPLRPPPRASVTPEEAERARESVRTARALVQRAAEEALDVEPWEEWATLPLGGRYTREQVRNQATLRTVMGPVILAHLEQARASIARAEAGGPDAGLAWVEAFEQLQGAHRLTRSLTSPWDALRDDPVAIPVRPILEAIDMADGAVEQALRMHEALVAFGAETWDDMHEAAAGASSWGPGLVLGALALAWFATRKGRG